VPIDLIRIFSFEEKEKEKHPTKKPLQNRATTWQNTAYKH